MTQIDIQAWMNQPRMLAERCRGLPLIWTPDVNWFNNDWLGPTPHVHDDATEIGFLAQGSLEIEVGGSKRVYKQGDFIMMPPNKYHNYWFKGSETACFFVVVAPNHKYKRLRDKDFTPDDYRVMRPSPTSSRPIRCPRTSIFSARRSRCSPASPKRRACA